MMSAILSFSVSSVIAIKLHIKYMVV